jgi:hypothetical protein
VIIPAYAKRISADQNLIGTDQNQIDSASQVVTTWRENVATDRVQVTCEAQGVTQFAGCGKGTGLVGTGQVYNVRLTELKNDEASQANAQAQATATKNRLSPQIVAAQSNLTRADAMQRRDYAQAQTRYLGNDGLIARWRALSELETQSSGINLEVRLLEGLIIAIDLAAVIGKLTSKTPSYNRALEASRKKVMLRAALAEEKAYDATDLRRAERQATSDIQLAWLDAKVHVTLAGIAAWTRVTEQKIQAWEAAQTGGVYDGSAAGGGGWQPPPPRAASAVPGKETSLTDLVKTARPHHRMVVNMAKPLRRIAWIGVSLLAALGAALLVARTAHAAIAGGSVVAAALAAALTLAVYSRGFHTGPAWAHRAAFGTGLLGLALPLFIVLVNV